MDKATLIDHYFEGTLSLEDQKQFQELLKSDADFASEVHFQKDVKKAITLETRKQLKEQLQEIESVYTPKKSKKQWLYIAAAIVVLIGILTFFFNQPPSHDKLFATYINPYPNVVTPIVRGNNEIPELQTRAFLAYEQQNFEQASLLFNQLRNETDADFAHFYFGVSSLMKGDAAEAKPAFESVNSSDKFIEQSDWYLALCLLKLKKAEAATAVLDKIIQSETYNFEIAKELKSKIHR